MKSASAEERKVWICLFTCCSSRAVHFEAVLNMTSEAFLRCFRRFVARRSGPSLVVSDNVKPSRVLLRSLRKLQMIPVLLSTFAHEKIKWSYNLEKAPWWEGFYERLVKSLLSRPSQTFLW